MKNVLFVDDHEFILDSFKRSFKDCGYSIFTANNVTKAIEILERIPIDVLLSDYRMPGSSGLDLFLTIQSDYPNMKRIMISGEADKGVIVDALNHCGLFRYFDKPCDKEVLGLAINEALELEQATKLNLRAQQLLIRDLERENPGISSVRRDSRGVIVIDDKNKDNY